MGGRSVTTKPVPRAGVSCGLTDAASPPSSDEEGAIDKWTVSGVHWNDETIARV